MRRSKREDQKIDVSSAKKKIQQKKNLLLF